MRLAESHRSGVFSVLFGRRHLPIFTCEVTSHFHHLLPSSVPQEATEGPRLATRIVLAQPEKDEDTGDRTRYSVCTITVTANRVLSTFRRLLSSLLNGSSGCPFGTDDALHAASSASVVVIRAGPPFSFALRPLGVARSPRSTPWRSRWRWALPTVMLNPLPKMVLTIVAEGRRRSLSHRIVRAPQALADDCRVRTCCCMDFVSCV
mmetsp:Transcript_57868/g.172086  ORF Transcript_57868/g.172086 Transcript_57868/m.172086 type:complete len:206 (+) Transcript_57868:166-783(+)